MEHLHPLRPSSHASDAAFDVEVKPSKSVLSPPRYTTWASPAKLKQEPIYGDESHTITATVVPKSLANGNSPPTSTTSIVTSMGGLSNGNRHINLPPAPSLPLGISMGIERHRLAEALRPSQPPPSSAPPPIPVTTIAHHLPLAAAAAAAKLQALHPNMSGGHHHPGGGGHHPHGPPMHPHPALRMMIPTSHHPTTSTSLQPMHVRLSSAASITPASTLIKTEPLRISASVNNGVPPRGPPPQPQHHQPPSSVSNGCSPPNGASANGPRKPGPSVILGEHGGVKTMIWTDSTTYWQSAGKPRAPTPSQPTSTPSPSQPQVPTVPSSSTQEAAVVAAAAQAISRGQPLPLPLPPGMISAANAAANNHNLHLKYERPDHEQLKMSSAVDGLLSLSSQGRRPSPSPHMVQISPVHLPHSSSPGSTPTSLITTSGITMMPGNTDLKFSGGFHSQPSPTMTMIPGIPGGGLNLSGSQTNTGLPPPPNGTQPPPPRRRSPMNMERLWAGDMSQLPAHVLESQNGHMNLGGLRPNQDPEDEDPLLCNICEDRATGLHYGIITCEGCKGFFKRTVQNKRVYSCVADGNCEINKAQRNRCQFCRFKKCLQQGMVLAAVREDRMPGGRNSGAVYNMYKVKYKKHKRVSSNGKSSSTPSTPGPPSNPQTPTIPSSTSGTDLDPFRRPRSESSGSGLEPNPKFYDPISTMAVTPPGGGMPPITTLHPVTSSPAPMDMYHPPPHKALLGGVNILRAALTGSNDIPQQYKNLGRQAKDKYEEHHAKLIHELIECDEFDDIATLKNIGELLSQNSSDLEDKLCKIGDSIVHKLVEWVTRLPFYHQLPKEVHTKLLTHKWHELLVLTTSAYQAIHGFRRMGTTRTDGEKVELHQEVATNLVTLQTCLTSMMGKPITMDQLRQDVGNMVEKITKVIAIFRQFQLKMEEYVCLKVIAMVSQEDLNNPTLDVIHEKYLACLRSFAKKHFPNQPNRVEELLVRLPEVNIFKIAKFFKKESNFSFFT